MKKQRADLLLMEKGFFDSREKAKRAIMAGYVFSGTERIDKPGMKVNTDVPLEVKGQPARYVGRGGLKLEKALDVFHLDVKGCIVLDIGASTGGFTDCCLQNGAALVYALDVGYNQLAWKLRQDERVIVMEKTNFRYVKPDIFTYGRPSFATIDVSFISLEKILPVLSTILVPGSDVVALIKPQFETSRREVGKKGIVKDPVIHEKVLREMLSFTETHGYIICGLSFSPITGGSGNIEFLLHLRNAFSSEKRTWPISKVVAEAHHAFGK